MVDLMKDVLQKIEKEIYLVAKKEDYSLRMTIGRGLLQLPVPELAIVYLIAKQLTKKSKDIFGTETISWSTNKDIGSGLTDLIIRTGVNTYAIEFKVGGSPSSYEDDIAKLFRLKDGNLTRLFCAIMDSWADDLDSHPRMVYVDKIRKYSVSRVSRQFKSFKTSSGSAPQRCIVGLWEVGAPNHRLHSIAEKTDSG